MGKMFKLSDLDPLFSILVMCGLFVPFYLLAAPVAPVSLANLRRLVCGIIVCSQTGAGIMIHEYGDAEGIQPPPLSSGNRLPGDMVKP